MKTVALLYIVATSPAAAQAPCPGDVDSDERDTIAELVAAVVAWLAGESSSAACSIGSTGHHRSSLGYSPSCF